MNYKFMKGLVAGMLVLSVFVSGAGEALAASLNSHPSDLATLMVKRSTGVQSNSGWSTNAYGTTGDTIAFHIYYHNNSSDYARNVRVRLSPQVTSVGTYHQFVATVSADNAPTVSGIATVSLSQASSMSFNQGSVVWRPNQGVFSSQALLYGQTGSEIFTTGLNLGDIGPSDNFRTQGSVVLNFKVGDATSPAFAPTAATNLATNVTSTSVRLNGVVFPQNGIYTSGRFEWGLTPSLGNVTVLQGIGSAQAIAYSSTLTGLTPNTTYFYRAVAENPNGTGRGEIVSFRTNSYVAPVVTGGTVTVVTKPESFIEKSVINLSNENGTRDSVKAKVGDTVRFTVSVANKGTGTLRNVKITDRIPTFLEFANSEKGVKSGDQREVVWLLGDLRAGEREIVQLDAVITKDAPEGITIENVARVESDTVTETSNSVLITIESGSGVGGTVAGAAAAFFGGSGFLPDTLLEWLATIAVIFGLILLFRFLTAEVEFRRAQRMAAINGMNGNGHYHG